MVAPLKIARSRRRPLPGVVAGRSGFPPWVVYVKDLPLWYSSEAKRGGTPGEKPKGCQSAYNRMAVAQQPLEQSNKALDLAQPVSTSVWAPSSNSVGLSCSKPKQSSARHRQVMTTGWLSPFLGIKRKGYELYQSWHSFGRSARPRAKLVKMVLKRPASK